MDAEHADDLAVADADEVDVLVVELIDQQAVAGALVLLDFIDEGAVVEPVNLLDLVRRFRPLEDEWTDLDHPALPPAPRRRPPSPGDPQARVPAGHGSRPRLGGG